MSEYIQSFPPEVQPVLAELRRRIRHAAPAARESISYHMPSYSAGERVLVFFAGWKSHVALYAVPAFDGSLEAEVAPFRSAKDTLKFPLSAPLPGDVVDRVLARLVDERMP